MRWRSALIEAGLPAGTPTARGRRPRFDRDACGRALAAAAAELGRVPSAPEYATIARASGERLPSYKTLRRHFDSWGEALQSAGLLDEMGALVMAGDQRQKGSEGLASAA